MSVVPSPVIPTSSPVLSPALPTPTGSPGYDPSQYVSYTVQSGDTLTAVAARFGVSPEQIRSAQPLSTKGLLANQQTLIIPRLVTETPYTQPLLPDSEIVDSPCGRDFDLQGYLTGAGGKLLSYTQFLNSQTLSGAEIVKLVEADTSVNPHVLLAFIEYRSQWVLGKAGSPNLTYPLGLNISGYEGLYLELSLTAKLLNIGYYGWRQGTETDLAFPDGGSLRIAPTLNAGTVALQYLFARLYAKADWKNALYGPAGFLATYQKLFGDPAACAKTVEPIFPDGLLPPTLELPFAPGEDWALTGGLHIDWNTGTPAGALDFAPITGETHCAVSRAWVLASAAGVVTRSAEGVLQLALTGSDGSPTGWELLYLHVAAKDRPAVGTILQTNDRIGHPSCEGGEATGSHVHLARLYRGEWIGAGDAIPLILSGWLALPGSAPYQSMLIKGDQVVVAHPDGHGDARIVR